MMFICHHQRYISTMTNYQEFMESVWTNDWFIFTWNAFVFTEKISLYTCLSTSASHNLGGNIFTNRKNYKNHVYHFDQDFDDTDHK